MTQRVLEERQPRTQLRGGTDVTHETGFDICGTALPLIMMQDLGDVNLGAVEFITAFV
jgi:hypothetical protein